MSNKNFETELLEKFKDLTFKSSKENDTKRENANIDGDTSMGTMLRYGSEASKKFCEECILKPEHAKAHKEGDIHIHDLDFYNLTTTCCQIELDKLFKGGFSTGHGHLREPSNITSASALACIVIQANQNEQHGGQSVPCFDYYLAPYVAKTYIRNTIQFFELNTSCADLKNTSLYEEMWEIYNKNKTMFCVETYEYLHNLADVFDLPLTFMMQKIKEMTEKQTFQAMEALIHNLNTMHSRAGAQIPFSSINYGTDTTEEGRMVVRNVLLATDKGLGNGETPIFPIQIFKVKEGVNYNKDDVNYDLFQLACKVSAKRLFPNFSFIDAPFNIGDYKEGDPNTEVAYMGCRTRVLNDVNGENITGGRGNLSFTSINLPRLAIEADKDLDKFVELLDEKLVMVTDQLIERFKVQGKKKVYNYPFLMGQGVWLGSENLDRDDEVGEVLKHGTLSIGFIGLAECLTYLLGKHHGESEEAQSLGYDIIQYMRQHCDWVTSVTGMNVTLLATPAEGLSGRFVKLDRERYGEIEGVTDRDYYTNSFHIPVHYNISTFEKIKIEAPYHELTNAGHISYVELDGDTAKNLSAFETIVRCMKESGVGYGSINHPVDRDSVCGYTGIIHNECPQCHRKEGDIPFERIRRITGYLVGTVDRFNDAKKAEVEDRVKHQTGVERL